MHYGKWKEQKKPNKTSKWSECEEHDEDNVSIFSIK